MGTFGGHALPGSFFIIFAIWWTVQAYRRYFRSQQKGERPYRSSVTFPFDCLPGRVGSWPWEGMLKIFFTTVGFAGEIITGFKDGHFAHLGNGQHATMFFFFGLTGLVDIMVHFKFPLPESTDYVAATLAFAVEDVLFMFHLHGRTHLDVLIHTLLVYVIHANVLMCLVEMKYRDSVTITLARSYLVLLQGTWFWQAGFILYNPIPGAVAWQAEDHDEMMIVTMMFAWHMAVNFIVILITGFFVNLAGGCSARSAARGGLIGTGASNGGRKYDEVRLLSSEGHGQRLKEDNTALLDDESGSDIDEIAFQRPSSAV